MRWGLIPSWAKDPSVAASTINARSETVTTKPAFRDPIRFRRCLIPADGFYEWQRTAKTKQPYCFEVNDGELFAFAGIWDTLEGLKRRLDKDLLDSDHDAKCRDRKCSRPYASHPSSRQLYLWLDAGMNNVVEVSNLLKPFDAPLMRCFPVSTRINNVANNDEACSARTEIAQIQNTLFT